MVDDFDSPKSIKEKEIPVKLDAVVPHQEQGRDK